MVSFTEQSRIRRLCEEADEDGKSFSVMVHVDLVDDFKYPHEFLSLSLFPAGEDGKRNAIIDWQEITTKEIKLQGVTPEEIYRAVVDQGRVMEDH